MNPNIIVAVAYYVVLLVWFGVLWKEKNPKPNEYFATTIPDEAMEREEIREVGKRYANRLLICAVISALLPLSLLFTGWMTVEILLWMICFLLLAVLSFCPYLQANKKIRSLKEEHHYMDAAKHLPEIDAKWKNGLFYYDPNDKRLLVEKKVGVGTCVNHGRPMGRFLTGLAGVAIVGIFILGIYLVRVQSAPLTLVYEDGTLKSGQIHTNYTMDVDMIQMAMMLEKLPDAQKIVGTGMENLMRGIYKVEGIGNCKVNLKPQNHAFILLYGEDGCYIFSADTDEETKKVFKELKEEL